MHVGEVHAAASAKRRRRVSRQAGRLQPAAAAPLLPDPVAGRRLSKAGGAFPVDMARARHDARIALNSIDWSRRDIVIWVPGTNNKTIHPSFEAAVRDSWNDGGVSLTKLEHEASWNMRPSIATGVATMRLVLAGIAAHGGNHRVMLAGESQGAWIIGEAIADPRLRRVVDRAVLMGHPFLAAHHYETGNDPAILEINHPGDQVAAAVKGDLTNALDAMVAIRKLQFGKIGNVVQAIVENPAHGVMLLGGAFRGLFLKGLAKDPHDYSDDMTRAVEFLRFGRLHDRSEQSVERRRSELAAALMAQAAVAA